MAHDTTPLLSQAGIPTFLMVVHFRNSASFIVAENSLVQRLCEAYDSSMPDADPIVTNPEQYRLLWENNYVRVLEYTDEPGVQTTPHQHPNSVMVTLSAFDRRLSAGDRVVDVSLPAGAAVWLPAQRHTGHNIGGTPTHTIFIELKGEAAGHPSDTAVGPASDSD